MTRLDLFDELQFQKWYADHAAKTNTSPNPDDPEHLYDLRGAYSAGIRGGADNHLDSRWKQMGHPRTFINGRDTTTQEPVGLQQIIDDLYR